MTMTDIMMIIHLYFLVFKKVILILMNVLFVHYVFLPIHIVNSTDMIILYFIDTFQLSYGESVDYLTNPKPNNMEEEEDDDDDDGDKNGEGYSIAPQLLAP